MLPLASRSAVRPGARLVRCATLAACLATLGAGPCARPAAPPAPDGVHERPPGGPPAGAASATVSGVPQSAAGEVASAALPPRAAAEAPGTATARVARAAALVRAARAAERTAGGPVVGGAAVAPSGAALAAARAAWDSAAAVLPEVGDWLALRAAALEPAPAARAARLAALTIPAARERAPLAESAGRTVAGDLEGAALALEQVGRVADAARLRLRQGGAGRTRARAALLDAVRGGAGAGAGADSVAGAAERVAAAGGPRPTPLVAARDAALVLDSAFAADPAAPLGAAERLAVARALAAGVGRTPALGRAPAAFAAAFAAGAGTAGDRALQADALARLGRWREAAAAWGAARDAGGPGAGMHAYRAARALLRAGDAAGASAALRATVARFPADSGAAAARFLLADLATDRVGDAEARAGFLAVAREHPTTAWAPTAALRAGVIALAAGDAPAAATELEAAAARWARTQDGPALAYWAGRARAAAGDAAAARAHWAALLARAPRSYYAMRAAQRLGQAAWAPAAGGGLPVDPVAAAAGRRAALLEQVALMPEAGMEREWLARWAEGQVARQLAAAAALLEGSGGGVGARPGPAIRLAARAVEAGASPTAERWRLLHPLLHADLLRREAAARGVDPALAAALVKQESNFTADAVSPAGARGLMQVMPDVGRSIWRGPGTWSPALLFQPEVNVALGMRHLQAALSGYPDVAYALAAYNAGAGRVRRWRTKPGTADPELFVERIPFEETRDYVRIVLRNRAYYRALYAW